MDELVGAGAEEYAARHTTPFAGAIAAAAEWTAANTSTPQMMAGLAEARLLEALVVATRARRVLEIGTFTAVGALTIAAALPEDGRLTTLEFDPETAEIARRHLAASPHGHRVELIVGDARETLAEIEGPLDLVWIDAWKVDYPAYYEAVRPKLAPHGVIAGDNLFRAGRVLDPAADDEHTNGVREFAARIQADPSVHNVLLTIGDGVMLSWANPEAG
jgi:caffeoyl-CoA O-methyltransferase